MNAFSNAETGEMPVGMEDFLPAPEGATHFDTCHYTVCRWHKEIDGKWAYFNEDSGQWKVYQNQAAATVEDFIAI